MRKLLPIYGVDSTSWNTKVRLPAEAEGNGRTSYKSFHELLKIHEHALVITGKLQAWENRLWLHSDLIVIANGDIFIFWFLDRMYVHPAKVKNLQPIEYGGLGVPYLKLAGYNYVCLESPSKFILCLKFKWCSCLHKVWQLALMMVIFYSQLGRSHCNQKRVNR